MHPVLLARTAREALTAGVLLFFSPPADRLLSLSLGTYNLARERGLSPLDIPQKFVLSALYELPFGAHKRYLNKDWLATQALSGWQVNGILNLRSGFPSDTRVARLPPVFTTTNRPIASLASPRW